MNREEKCQKSLHNKILLGNALEVLKSLPGNFIDCCVTSPPYWGLRDYNVDGQIGLEKSLPEYLERIRQVFNEVRRVLKPTGTLWLNLGDAYSKCGYCGEDRQDNSYTRYSGNINRAVPIGLKRKDLIGLPWRVAFALQADGWYLRSDIIWSKSNPMPESVKDRPTKSHEYIFLLSKKRTYYYNSELIMEERIGDEDAITFRGDCYLNKETDNDQVGKRGVKGNKRVKVPGGWDTNKGTHGNIHREGRSTAHYNSLDNPPVKKNKRTVWVVATQPFPEAHFATFPERLIIPCIQAGCPEDGIVLDPFMGAGTTALVARRLNRKFLGIELNPDYIKIAEQRLHDEIPLFL